MRSIAAFAISAIDATSIPAARFRVVLSISILARIASNCSFASAPASTSLWSIGIQFSCRVLTFRLRLELERSTEICPKCVCAKAHFYQLT
ncbi:hypothetical protein I35_4817 [Burkholderia cenocepacia H111]|nr:hypothetical protein I35_4817 [Burkholderia cenocepacia H111]